MTNAFVKNNVIFAVCGIKFLERNDRYYYTAFLKHIYCCIACLGEIAYPQKMDLLLPYGAKFLRGTIFAENHFLKFCGNNFRGFRLATPTSG